MAFSTPPAFATDPPLTVYTVNYPLAYFAERVGGDLVRVYFPAPADVDPAFWKPSAETIGAFQTADLILLNGAGYASWIGQASLSRRKLVDTSRAFADAYVSSDRGPLHQHGPAGEQHAHRDTSFTTWLDPLLAIEQARAIEAAFAARLPDQTQELAERANALVADLEEIDRELASAFDALRSKSVFASHPIYGYLARRYGLDIHSFVWEPDVGPAESEWRTLDQARSSSARRWMLWEVDPLESTRVALEGRGVGIIVFEAVGNRSKRGDLVSVLRRNIDAVRGAVDAEARSESPEATTGP